MTSSRVAPHRRCGAMTVHHWLLEQHPSFRVAQSDLERAHTDRMRTMQVARSAPLKVSVVVHVVYNTAAENISDAQIKSQVEALNRDYRRKNADVSIVPSVWHGLPTDAGIEFALAAKDPAGAASNGITRTKTTRAGFASNDKVKRPADGGVAPWDATRYLNIWVCSLRDGLLGYAQFPGGPAASDGVVILNTAFGTTGTASAPFNLGRTATHEVGHYFNLRHIWGDTEDCSGTDFIADTPNAQSPNYGTPQFPHISCSNGPSGDMFMNYMDYVDDGAMAMFTPGQVARMHSTLDGPRSSLVRP